MSRKGHLTVALCLAACCVVPSVWAGEEQHELAVLQDEMVTESFPTYNWSHFAPCGGLAVGSNYSGDAARSYLQWDLSSLDASKPVVSATMRAYLNYEAPSCTADRPIEVHFCEDDGWSDSTINWQDAPAPAPEVAASLSSTLIPGHYYEWDVTGLVEAELVGDKTLSVVLMESGEGESPPTYKYFAEKEYLGGTRQPWLIVVLDPENGDTDPPSLDVSCAPAILWPPNHRYVEVKVQAQATDDVDGPVPVHLLSWESSEPDDAKGGGDGHTKNDVIKVNDTTFKLRAERSASGKGRTYTITYWAIDSSENKAMASCTVVVPHDKGDK